jgi:hypothetical protein
LQSLSSQLHDFNVGMGPDVGTVSGGNNFGTRVFWTAAVPDGDIQVDPVAGTAHMQVQNLATLDFPEDFGGGSLGPNWQTAYVPATVSFDVVWHRPVSRQVTVNDPTDQFAGTFAENQATVVWSARSTSGFRFNSSAGSVLTSTPGAPNIATTYYFAEVGHEQNGIFFSADSSVAALLQAQVSASAALPAPAATGPAPLPPQAIAAPLARPDGSSLPIQAASTLHGLTAGQTPAPIVDRVVADLDASALWDQLESGEGLLWGVWRPGRDGVGR